MTPLHEREVHAERRVDALLDVLGAIRTLHRSVLVDGEPRCMACGTPPPCPTTALMRPAPKPQPPATPKRRGIFR